MSHRRTFLSTDERKVYTFRKTESKNLAEGFSFRLFKLRWLDGLYHLDGPHSGYWPAYYVLKAAAIVGNLWYMCIGKKCLEHHRDYARSGIQIDGYGPASHGQIKAICLLRSWDYIHPQDVIAGAACGGHIKLMILARKWGACQNAGSLYNLVSEATSGRSPQSIYLARRWMLEKESIEKFLEAVDTNLGYQGHIPNLRLIKRWGCVSIYNLVGIFHWSVMNERIRAMKFLKTWLYQTYQCPTSRYDIAFRNYVNSLDAILSVAAENGVMKPMKLIYKWGREMKAELDSHGAMRYAAISGNLETMRLAKKMIDITRPMDRQKIARDIIDRCLEAWTANDDAPKTSRYVISELEKWSDGN